MWCIRPFFLPLARPWSSSGTDLWRFVYEQRTLPAHMPLALTNNPRTRDWIRRAAALAMFALQGAVALATVADSAHLDRPQAHVEERGAIHPRAHDESRCALCSVRSLHLSVPARPCRIATVQGRQCAMTLIALVAPAPDVGPTNHSRAPPLAC